MKKILVWLCCSPALLAQLPDMPASVLPASEVVGDDAQDPMRSRLFRTTGTRAQMDLGGWWDFLSDPADSGESLGYHREFPRPETTLWIPGTWNVVARYWNYVGPGWYRRRFDVPSAGNLRICFGGIFYSSKVWLDGKLLGEHEGGYLPFSYTVTGVEKGRHTLIVRADNRLSDLTLPKKNVDWFPYGGIDRPVFAEMVPLVFIERVHVVPASINASRALLRVSVAVENLGAPAEEQMAFTVDGVRLYTGGQRIAAGSSTINFEAVLKEPRLWSTRSPNLYSAQVVLGANADDQFVRFGVREIRTDGSRILLNGERLRLMGANRHEDHPDWGSAAPPHLIRQDIEILKRLGANAVRAHYALPELFLDYCDQYGFVVLAEAPAWQYSAAQLAKTEIQEKIVRSVDEMVKRDANHPSIIAWSLGNEWPDPDRSYDVIRSMVARARKLDSTRLITFVTGGPSVRRVHELTDVISVNWARYQWYDPFTTLDRSEGEKSVSDLSKIHARYPNKPVILTELGGAESQAGWHNWGNVKWSEEFQARNVEDSAWHALDQDWISGGCVWQFADTRSAPERFLAGRLHGWNGKGVVDAYRSPKLAFYRLQHVYRSQPGSAGAGGGR